MTNNLMYWWLWSLTIAVSSVPWGKEPLVFSVVLYAVAMLAAIICMVVASWKRL